MALLADMARSDCGVGSCGIARYCELRTRASDAREIRRRRRSLSITRCWVAPEYPCTWPAHPFPRFQITHQRTIGPDSAYNIDVLLIDGNTGTQLDVPPHSVPRPGPEAAESPGRSAWLTPTRSEPGSSAARRASSMCATCSTQAPNGSQPAGQAGARRAVREAASAAAVRRRRAVSQRLHRQVLPAVSGRQPLHCRRARSQGARLGPIPIPSAWSTWPAAR